MYLYTAQEMRDLDRYAIEEIGIPGMVLMENAGHAVARRLLDRWRRSATAVVLSGSGNNGGDGFVIARRLASAGWDVSLWIAGSVEKMSQETRTFYEACIHAGVTGEFYDSSQKQALARHLEHSDVVVDALLGTGIRGELREPVRTLIRMVNQQARGFVVAVDVPSGVDTDTGAVASEAVVADKTITFAHPKWCHYLRPAAERCGNVRVEDIGIPQQAVHLSPPSSRINEPSLWQAYLKPRSRWSHKGDFGHLLVVGGSRGMLGAAVMAGTAALRTGAGLATVAVPEGQEQALAAQVTEALVWGWPDDGQGHFSAGFPQDWEKRVRRLKAVAAGPGLGRFDGEEEWLRRLLQQAPVPLVLDADALNILSKDPSLLRERRQPTVLTPHPGEMARLSGQGVKEVESSRRRIAREWAQAWGVTVVLKGTYTLIAFPDGTQVLNTTGGPALAKAGSGDILTGILGALLARGIPEKAAVPMGVYLHGLAGQQAVTSTEHSVLARDVIAAIGPAIRPFL
ncbi:NAD(P)H-hydrate dehydratase [Paludifilum halophilum]|uniref:Bifunctional NAD(P)H-hydrate repair enzyme n=1 Tax=Paludifilum halophilum TaxID=1642702 RepID=A0A235B3C3_9BACL|nr:NAD(P)H-hydrate dehydratase [Paludifilum halophilum]OYD06784.1 hypothetical protein CHM34_14615 [Paludifilum halophilum]